MQTNLARRRVVVMGLGRFGGGVGAARYCARHGANVLVTDLQPAHELRQSTAQLDGLPIDYRLGGYDPTDFTGADLIVVNPAVRRDGNEFLAAATASGATLTSEIQLLVERLPDRRSVIGVTGSAGKSTTTTMIGHVMDKAQTREATAARRAWVGGNLGGSLLENIEQIGPDDWVVLELSSFMLAALDDDRWSPGIAVVTNIAANHLDWHADMADYAAAKRVIVKHQQRGDFAVLGAAVADWPTNHGVTRHVVDKCADGLTLALPGEHNGLNATCALTAAQAAGVTCSPAALADFAGLPHRLQFVCVHENVRYFNDSKSTTPEAAQLAISSFAPATVHAIVGGYDKQADLSPLARFAAQRCRAIYTVGATGDAIAADADAGPAQVVRCQTVAHAVAQTACRVRPGDTVLLSPGCASWDQFAHFEQRGEMFVAAVLGVTGETDTGSITRT